MKEYIIKEHPDFPYEEPKPPVLTRCKNCYFYGIFGTLQKKHYCTKFDHTVKQDGFCAWAERKEE